MFFEKKKASKNHFQFYFGTFFLSFHYPIVAKNILIFLLFFPHFHHRRRPLEATALILLGHLLSAFFLVLVLGTQHPGRTLDLWLLLAMRITNLRCLVLSKTNHATHLDACRSGGVAHVLVRRHLLLIIAIQKIIASNGGHHHPGVGIEL